jgi:hypothetical protein
MTAARRLFHFILILPLPFPTVTPQNSQFLEAFTLPLPESTLFRHWIRHTVQSSLSEHPTSLRSANDHSKMDCVDVRFSHGPRQFGSRLSNPALTPQEKCSARRFIRDGWAHRLCGGCTARLTLLQIYFPQYSSSQPIVTVSVVMRR